jgi:hypothetical protein
MERMGPRGGDIVRLDLVMAGESAAEVDCVGCAVMGHNIDEVRHLKYFIEANGIDPVGIETAGEAIGDVRHPFAKVRVDAIVPSQFSVHDTDACCACMNAFLLSCGLLEEEPPVAADVYLGSTVALGGATRGAKIAFGRCCPDEVRADIRINGCPPYPFALKECLERIRNAGGRPSPGP